jgi:Flp pilus assembly protein TadB
MDPWLVRLLLIVAVFALSYPFAYSRFKKERDPDWEARWGELSWRERGRLMKAARRGERPLNPEEAELVAGSARFQRTFDQTLSPILFIRYAVAALVILAALATGSPVMIAIALVFLALLAWFYYRDRIRKRNLERAEDGD